MKLTYHCATTMTSSLEKDVEIAAAAGFRALEIWAAKMDRYLAEHSLEDLRALFVGHGVEPLALSSLEFIAFRGDEYPALRARLLQLCEISRAIGCASIVLVPSPLPDRTLSWQQVVEEYVRVLRDLAAAAAPFPLRLGFEPLGFGWCSVRTPRAALEIVQQAACENLGIIIDAAHFFAGGGLLDELERIPAEKLVAFHLNDLEDNPKEAMTDATRLMPGQGILPLDEICRRIKDIGYNGPCSVELFRPEYWNQDPLHVARQAYTAARQVLAPYFELE